MLDFKYTKEDFLTDEPYKFLFHLKKSDPFEHECALAAIKDNARAVGVRNFNATYAAYVRRARSCQGNT